MGSLHLSDLEAASWGSSWEPDARRDGAWLDDDTHPPDEEHWLPPVLRDVRSILERIDAHADDVRRLRRLFGGN